MGLLKVFDREANKLFMEDTFCVRLKEVSKRYRWDWIFQNLNYTFQFPESYAILGRNGSGKSTLLQILSGYLSPSSGKVFFEKDQKEIELDTVFRYISYMGPYIELLEEFNMREAITFHQKFKPFVRGLSVDEVIEELHLPKNAMHKPLKFFSSGMKQRLKLALACLSESEIVLLDEPSITLDKESIHWYNTLLEKYVLGKKMLIIASNVEADYVSCTHQLSILDYKPKKRKYLKRRTS